MKPRSGPGRADRYPTLSEWLGGVAFSPLDVAVAAGWSQFNPSMARLADGSLRGVIRSSNYVMEQGRYLIDDVDGAIRTTNVLIDLDERGEVVRPRPIVEPGTRTVSDFPVHGYEDVRLAPVGDTLWALATVRDADASGLCRVALLTIADDGRVLEERFVDGPTPGRHEKNWVPFSGDGLRVVYSWDPLVVASIDCDPATPDSDRFRELSSAPSGLGPNARGGTNGVRIDEGWLFLVHESRRFPDGQARYLHRLVTVRDDFTLGRTSPLLTLMTDGVEFGIGAALVGSALVDGTAEGDELLIGFGLHDAEAWAARVSLASVLERLTVPGADQNPS